ncbi:hypothetical protein ACLOJK_013559 [Asimina triloba]
MAAMVGISITLRPSLLVKSAASTPAIARSSMAERGQQWQPQKSDPNLADLRPHPTPSMAMESMQPPSSNPWQSSKSRHGTTNSNPKGNPKKFRPIPIHHPIGHGRTHHAGQQHQADPSVLMSSIQAMQSSNSRSRSRRPTDPRLADLHGSSVRPTPISSHGRSDGQPTDHSTIRSSPPTSGQQQLEAMATQATTTSSIRKPIKPKSSSAGTSIRTKQGSVHGIHGQPSAAPIPKFQPHPRQQNPTDPVDASNPTLDLKSSKPPMPNPTIQATTNPQHSSRNPDLAAFSGRLADCNQRTQFGQTRSPAVHHPFP